jgi:hypothetical protein
MIDERFILSNRLEAGLWCAIGAGFAIAAFIKPKAVRTDCLIAAVTFVAFGMSDVVETHTGAWWRPWWLLVWKAVCVLGFLVLLVRYRMRTRARR